MGTGGEKTGLRALGCPWELSQRDNTGKLLKGMSKMTLGTSDHPIIVRTTSEEKMKKIVALCAEYHWHYIIGFEAPENLDHLKTALRQRLTPDDVYAPCSCGSGKKFKFCCAEKIRHLDVNQVLEEFVPPKEA